MENDERLHRLPPEAVHIAPPRQFTFPFCYEPHPLCGLAAEEVKKEVALHADWQEEIKSGKMLGVLIVGPSCDQLPEDKAIGFLAAFSGTLCRKGTLPYFVPPVFDLHGTYFETEEARISSLPLGEERKQSSQALQQWLFDQFRFLNAEGNVASMYDIFGDKYPPSGTGECCAPKLLQYAYLHGLHPLCMGEFWMGKTPKGEIREEGHFYPSCQHKCKPLLGWMLRGLNVEENPMQRDYARLVAQFHVVYEDSDIAVVFKPSGLLSVPGKDFLPSVQDLAQQYWPQAEGPLIVHRLDMDTSGLMVVALTNRAYHHLQDQFVRHFIKKRYTAYLEKFMRIGERGKIALPLCPNPNDRPRQIVNSEYGRRAITRYEVVGNRGTHAIVHLWPETGRTHQLRVHMAHSQGLANPILGDRLYGHPNGGRLMLFADRLEFEHPTTGAPMTFSTEEE